MDRSSFSNDGPGPGLDPSEATITSARTILLRAMEKPVTRRSALLRKARRRAGGSLTKVAGLASDLHVGHHAPALHATGPPRSPGTRMAVAPPGDTPRGRGPGGQPAWAWPPRWAPWPSAARRTAAFWGVMQYVIAGIGVDAFLAARPQLAKNPLHLAGLGALLLLLVGWITPISNSFVAGVSIRGVWVSLSSMGASGWVHLLGSDLGFGAGAGVIGYTRRMAGHRQWRHLAERFGIETGE